MKKIFFLICALFAAHFTLYTLLFTFFSVPRALAVSEFTTNFESVYTVRTTGLTEVSHNISLKNNLSHIYATNYTISLSGEDLKYINASDEYGEINTSSSIQNGVTTISLKIDKPAIGKDQTKNLKLNYQTNDVVEKIGESLTINIPRLAKANEAEKYIRIVKVEDVPGTSKFIYPDPDEQTSEDRYTIYSFIGHQNDSLTLLFGDSVTYLLNLTYELKNKELNQVDSELALPPDTGYQSVVLGKIEPEPKDIQLDENGNWLARYQVKSQDKLLVKAEVYVTVYPTSVEYDPSPSIFQKTPHSKYWEPNSSSVTTLAEQLKTPQNFYNYLTTNFTYNFSSLNALTTRLGVAAALASPTQVLCTEFTDTFVSLARARNIPSREINGYGYTKKASLQPQNLNFDVLHAWPEYYDSESRRWVSIDPTWGNTTGGINYFSKLDFSHITFVRHGLEDSYPLPPGAYKSNPAERHVNVEVANTAPTKLSNHEITKVGSKYQITNKGNHAMINQTIYLNDSSYKVNYLPPYSTESVNQVNKISLWNKLKIFVSKLATWAHIR